MKPVLITPKRRAGGQTMFRRVQVMTVEVGDIVIRAEINALAKSHDSKTVLPDMDRLMPQLVWPQELPEDAVTKNVVSEIFGSPEGAHNDR